jgi:hypothetical protein
MSNDQVRLETAVARRISRELAHMARRRAGVSYWPRREAQQWTLSTVLGFSIRSGGRDQACGERS